MATPVEWLNEFQVNTGRANTPSVSNPVVTGLSNGNFLVAWVEAGTNGVATDPSNDIIGKIFDAEGNLVRDSYRLNAFFADEESDFDVAATNDGGFIIVYMDNDIGTDETDVIYQRHNATGNASSAPTIIDDTPGGFTFRNPQITVNQQDNTSVLQFENTSSGDEGVFLRTLTSTGVVTDNRTVNDDSSSNEFDGDIAMLANGNVVSVWTDSSGGDSVQYRIQTATGASVTVASDIDPTGRNAQVTALADGGFVVVYENYNINNGGITAGRYDAAGSALSFTQVAGTSDNENEPDVIALPDGGYVIVWDNDTNNTLEAQRFDSNGNADGSLFTVENVATTAPNISVTGDGRILFAWDDQSGDNILASIWDPRSNPIDGSNYDDNTRIFLDTNTLTSLTTSSTVNGTGAGETIIGQGGNDILNANGGDDTITGGNGNDEINGGSGNDIVDAGAGNDTITDTGFLLLSEKDEYDGGAGIDTFIHLKSWSSGVTFDLLTGEMTSGGTTYDTFSNIENITVSGAATVIGDNGANVITIDDIGGASENTLNGNGGDDTLSSGTGNDFLFGGSGDDKLYGGAGNDILSGGVGDDLIDGGAGFDTADYAGLTGNIVANIQFGGAQRVSAQAGRDTFVSVEGLFGGAGDDLLVGSSAGNVILGGAGNDEIYGIGGGDILNGGAGNDLVEGSGGNDTMNGAAGIDILSYFNSAGSVTVNLANQGVAQAVGGSSGTDTFFNFENLYGSNAGNDTLRGNSADNVILGYSGNDTIYGGAGNDTLIGQRGTDVLVGNAGADTLNGGNGADTFDFDATSDSTIASRDTIVDFGVGGADRIDLSTIDANTTIGGNQTFNFIGGAAFTGAGQARFVTNGTDGFVLVETNGGGSADMNILLLGVTTMDAGDFVL